MSRRHYVHFTWFDDQYECLVDGSKIIRIQRMFSDSGMIKDVHFDDLSEGQKKILLRKLNEDENGQ